MRKREKGKEMDNAVAADKYSEDWREATIIFNYCTLDTVQ